MTVLMGHMQYSPECTMRTLCTLPQLGEAQTVWILLLGLRKNIVFLSGGEHGGDKPGSSKQSPAGDSLGDEDVVHTSSELPSGSMVYMKYAESPAHSPHPMGEKSNPTTCSMCPDHDSKHLFQGRNCQL